ncbi:MAG: chromosome segregation protein SMC [Deltaproteobacteria bacterium]|nr:chromosome segregation protein SMC [Deltaproteobacteria bacterium]
MKIKRLTVNGFKSFMDKVDIPFPMGISAVVGPNGCGKSNIVDAIRWAMGEQSAKQLRGRNMEDVIFNGAGNNNPLGMAEVTIVLENGDGSFPMEYMGENEIAITRRLYRSGESEYLINSVPCRLKDIQEIFMDTGLGNRAYSIIGQGMIGSIVEQKPEETRVMLEEAAGITRYKRKEAESQRKLELTKRNLNRVEDILVEVQSQMRSLKRQSAKAKRYKALGEEIQRLELVINSNTYVELMENSGKSKKIIDELIQTEVEMTTDLSRLHALIEKMNLELEEKNYEISKLRSRHISLKDDFSKKETALEAVANEKRMQKEMEARLNREVEDISRRILSLGEEKTLLTEKKDKLNKASLEKGNEISVMEERLEGRKRLLNEAKQEYERVRNRVSSDINREIGLNKESGYISNRIGEISDSKARLETEKESVSEKIEKLIGASAKKNETRQALSDKLADIDRDILETKQACEEMERVEKNNETDLKAVEAELTICNTRLSGLRSLSENFEGYKVGVRTIMKANDLRARSQGRILGLVADVIQVEPKYEQAVETVLADKLQYIIVEDLDDGRESIEYLKRKEKGRSSFIPLNCLNGSLNNGNMNGFPLLRELVNVPDKYRHLVDTLLGDAALASNLDEAINAWKTNGKEYSLVTPEGDIIDRRGILSGGKLSSGSHGLLSRKREIRELTERSAGYEETLKEYLARRESIRHEIEGKKLAIGALEKEKWDSHEKINELDKLIFQIGHELDQLEKLSEKINQELEVRSNEHERHRDELKRIEIELRQCEEKKRTEEEFLLRKGVEVKETEEEYDKIRNEFEKLKMEFSLAREEERGLIREIERIDDFVEESRGRSKRINLEILEGHEKDKVLTEKEETLREDIKIFYTKLKQAEEAVNQVEQDRNNFQAQIREEEKKSGDLREKLDQIKEKITLARMEQSEIGFKINNLAEIIKDRFNLDLFTIYRDFLEENFSETDTRGKLEHQKILRERLGEVNLMAIQEHEALKERHDFIQTQREDLLKSIDSIAQAIRKINRTCLDRFMETFKEADNKIKQVFPILFNGGSAGLKLTDESRPLESGVLVEVRPPGKKLSHMGLLSGGEKALVAMSLLFAIYLIKPSPFCLLDEVDAPLDEANIDRFNNLLSEIKKYSQILMVTHNRRTMEIVDSLYGVTMERAGISKMVAVELNQDRQN